MYLTFFLNLACGYKYNSCATSDSNHDENDHESRKFVGGVLARRLYSDRRGYR